MLALQSPRLFPHRTREGIVRAAFAALVDPAVAIVVRPVATALQAASGGRAAVLAPVRSILVEVQETLSTAAQLTLPSDTRRDGVGEEALLATATAVRQVALKFEAVIGAAIAVVVLPVA